MVFVISMSVFLISSCESEEANKLCPVAQFAMPFFSSQVVNILGTCDPGKISEAILDKMNCDKSKMSFTTKGLVGDQICPFLINMMGDFIGQYGYSKFDCDPKLMEQFELDEKLCDKLNF